MDRDSVIAEVSALYPINGSRMTEIDMSEANDERSVLFSQEQYELLVSCSELKDVTEWNEWVKSNRDVGIMLEGAQLEGAVLTGAHLQKANMKGAHLERAHLRGAHLEEAHLEEAHLEGAELYGAHLEGAFLECVHLERAHLTKSNMAGANLIAAHMERTHLRGAHLEGANISEAHLERALMQRIHLEGATLWETHLEEANLHEARLQGTDLWRAHLEGANCGYAITDGATLLVECTTDSRTDFSGVGLRSARIESQLKSRLEGNCRRFKWENWYKGNRGYRSFLNWPVKSFWWMSKYGQSVPRVILTFFLLALIFSGLYCIPGVVDGLYVVGETSLVTVPGWLVPFRAVYFSIVTMTTLGFGDVVASPLSFWGHIILTIQVILGYVLLAALVSRLAILFQES